MARTEGRITLWGIEVFVATAAEGSISAAARRLDTSVATVSQQLTNLEAAIGTDLLDRGQRPIGLTPKGEIFLRRANAILNEAEQARAELALSDMSRLTRFRLGMIEDFDADVTPALLSRMGEELKQCQFLLETGASHRLYDLLDERALDVVVAADMGATGAGMEVHRLLEEPFVAAVPKGQGATAFDEMPLIQYTTRHHMGRTIAAHLARENVTLGYRFELDSYHAILAMVAGGTGWTILTPLALSRAQRFNRDVDILPLPFAPMARVIQLTARQGVLGAMPATVAGHLRGLLQDQIVGPEIAARPWLDGRLRVL
ncbi:LysR family transcriptional regulator [Loktanella sp. IMCC34160]|uniref:LysR family transcriptional regulator n=1 Tax=Loktanella sp. IMCC34160 TaxID=2510646 RepID=UPI00101D18D9|nr:LysR family transcriptional regulator [Loktanella sp. IMCC34160]RYG89328.1 LysR family transcriptional regulator [Loktanella sp. IMCC34160]